MTKIKKHHVGVLVEKNAFVDEGDGVVYFPNGLSITDDSIQRNGTRYNIESMKLEEYKGQVTADHVDKLENIIAKVENISKVGNKVVVNRIRYAIKESTLARLAYNLLVNGFSTDFSIETYGPQPDDELVYNNASLIGLSQVVVGNNRGANTAMNAVIKNSLEQSKEDGLDTEEVEEALRTEFAVSADHKEEVPADTKEEAEEIEEIEAEETEVEEKQNNNKKENDEMKFVTIKNSRDFAVVVTYKNAAGEDKETTLDAGETVDVSEDQKEAVETQITAAEAPKVEEEEKKEEAENAIADIVKNAIAPFQDEVAKLRKAFDESAKEPAFKPAKTDVKSENAFAELDYKERHAKQINATWEYLKLGNIEAAKTLNELNQVNLDALKAAGKVENALSISDFGNFVISPELLTEIQGFRSDYSRLIDATDWRETTSLQFAWLKRSGDINMQNVGLEPGVGGDDNLKPISEYSAEPTVSNLEELAAVTPVCNSATRFLAVDLLGDVARGYRNDYDRKRAQLVVARLQQAVNANSGNRIQYAVEPSPSALNTWSQLWAKVSEVTLDGVYVFNYNTYAQIQQAAVSAGVQGPLSSIFLSGDVPTIFGNRFIIVPNDLMPSLNSGETRTFEVEGANVTINNAVFYFNTNNFTGRTSGGLQYDLSTDAAYEQNGTVKSAYQRNELVLRGSFFRGGAVLDDTRVAAMASNVAPISS